MPSKEDDTGKGGSNDGGGWGLCSGILCFGSTGKQAEQEQVIEDTVSLVEEEPPSTDLPLAKGDEAFSDEQSHRKDSSSSKGSVSSAAAPAFPVSEAVTTATDGHHVSSEASASAPPSDHSSAAAAEDERTEHSTATTSGAPPRKTSESQSEETRQPEARQDVSQSEGEAQQETVPAVLAPPRDATREQPEAKSSEPGTSAPLAEEERVPAAAESEARGGSDETAEAGDPYLEDRKALESLEKTFHQAVHLYKEEQLVHPKMLIDTILRETEKRLARTSILASSEQTDRYVEDVTKLKNLVSTNTDVKCMNTKMEILAATFEFFSLEHLVENVHVGFSKVNQNRSAGGGSRTLASRLGSQAGSYMGGGTMQDGSPGGGNETAAGGSDGTTRSAAKGARGNRKKKSLIARSFSGRFKMRSARGGDDERSVLRGRSKRKATRTAIDEGGGNPWIQDKQRNLQLSYRTEANGSISVKVRGKLRCELFRVLSVVAETDFYNLWVPYLKEANIVSDISRCSRLVQMLSEYPWPLKYKESIMYAFGVDALDECGSVIICGRSPPEAAEEFMGVAVPPPMKKVQRVPCNHLCFIMQPLENGAATMLEVYSNLDPGVNLRLLSGILQWIVKKSVKGFYVKISNFCDNFIGSKYEERVNENPELYGWIQRRIKEYFADGGAHSYIARDIDDSLATLHVEDFKEYL